MVDKSCLPACFGILENVFPKGKDGLRHTPGACMKCDLKVECLKEAMSKEKLTFEEEKVDRAYEAGQLSFLERWARKKSIYRRKRSLGKKL